MGVTKGVQVVRGLSESLHLSFLIPSVAFSNQSRSLSSGDGTGSPPTKAHRRFMGSPFHLSWVCVPKVLFDSRPQPWELLQHGLHELKPNIPQARLFTHFTTQHLVEILL